jgi:hypothetical protein
MSFPAVCAHDKSFVAVQQAGYLGCTKRENHRWRNIMTSTRTPASPYTSIAPYIQAERLERVVDVAEILADAIAESWRVMAYVARRWWADVSEPPRAAYMIMAVREKREGMRMHLMFTPR